MEDSRVVAGNLIAAARNIATNTEVGQLADAKDLQLVLSRIDTTRPFFVICAKDTVLNQLAGLGTLEFPLSNVRRHRSLPATSCTSPPVRHTATCPTTNPSN